MNPQPSSGTPSPTAPVADTSSTVVMLTGRFDAFETESFRTHFDGLIARGTGRITVDLREVQFIDSTGLAELVRAMKACKELGGQLVLRNPSPPVTVILELTRLDTAFTIISDPS